MYLYKYLFKGPDHTQFHLLWNKETGVNEITDYINGRYLSAPEAAWRILNFEIVHKQPSVSCLPVHLPGQNTPLRKSCNITFGPLCIWDPGPQYIYFVLWNAIISSHRWLFKDSSVQIIIGTKRNPNRINGGRSPPSFGRSSTLPQYLWSMDLAKNSLMPQVHMILSSANDSPLNLWALAIASFRREINTSTCYIGKESLTLPHHSLVDVLNGWGAPWIKRWLSLRWVPIIYYDCLALAACISDCSIECLPLWCSIVTII